MPIRAFICLLTALLALGVATTAAGAADTVVVPIAEPSTHTPGLDTYALAALDGTIVWRRGTFKQQTLMQRTPDGTITRVLGAPEAFYPSIDLGRDADGQLVLTYLRCEDLGRCKAYSDDLAGHRVAFKHLPHKRCELTAAPARWGARVAYGQLCSKLRGRPNADDRRRSGLYVRKGSGTPTHLRLPAAAMSDGFPVVRWVDLRATTVAAAAASGAWHVFAQRIDGTRLRSADDTAWMSSDAIASLALGTRGAVWTLRTRSGFPDHPNTSLIARLIAEGCTVSERLVDLPAGAPYPAESMAADGDTLYLYVPGTGIVRHEFRPTLICP